MKKHIIINWLAFAAVIALVVCGGILNREHQKHWTDADTNKVLDDTIKMGSQTFVRVRPGDTPMPKRIYEWGGAAGRLYKRIDTPDTVNEWQPERKDSL